jgi:hypothetical protein
MLPSLPEFKVAAVVHEPFGAYPSVAGWMILRPHAERLDHADRCG